MSSMLGAMEDFGMDTISLAGTLEAKLKAIKDAGFTQVMLSARDVVSHPEGFEAAVNAVKTSGLRVTGFQVLRDFEGLSGHLHHYKIDIAKAMLEMCHALGSKVLLVCSSTSVHASNETAVLANFQFHFGIYRASGMTDLVTILESVWLRNGPLLKYLYPHAAPTYPGKHQHLNLIKALRLGDADAARQAIQHDMVEGGARLIELLAMIEDGRAVVAETAQGGMQLEFHAPAAKPSVRKPKR